MSSYPVEIRPPMLIRLYVAAFVTFWLAGVVWVTIVRGHGPSVAIGIAFIAFGCSLGYRLLRLGVRSGPDGALIVRNNLGTRRLTHSQIQEFRISSTGGGRFGQRGVQALLSDGTVFGLDVCRTTSRPGSRRLTQQLLQLNTWLGTAPRS